MLTYEVRYYKGDELWIESFQTLGSALECFELAPNEWASLSELETNRGHTVWRQMKTKGRLPIEKWKEGTCKVLEATWFPDKK